jgi:thioredoxin reductase (NADPH)
MPVDFVFAMTGYRPDPQLLHSLGVDIDVETGIPAHDPATMETNVPGVYIAGVIAAGFNANKIFIENGREHGPKIVAAIRTEPTG